jgi:glycosyltransferase involved in cell wall biosynthesis
MVASSYPRYDGDSASIFLRYLAQRVADAGFQVHILAPSDARVRFDVNDKGVKVHYFRYFPKCQNMLAYGSGILPNIRNHPWTVVQIPFFIVSMFFSVLKLSRVHRPDIIHAHWLIPVGLVAALSSKFTNVPVVVTAHGGDAFGMKGRLARLLKTLTMRNSDAWTANTEGTAAAAFGTDQLDSQKLSVIPMGVDASLFASGNRTELRGELDSEVLLILFVGRLVEKKGVRHLIEAAAHLINQRSIELQLWIVGDGECSTRLKELAACLEIEAHVRFFGAVPNNSLPDYYAAADLFVAPSVVDQSGDTEGQGVVIIEAMAAGVAVVASRVGGISGVIDDGSTGILCEPESSMALSNAIEELVVSGRSASFADRAREKIEREYDWSVVARRFSQLYRRILR